MSADKEKLNQLLQKVEELTVTLNKVSEELRSVSASLKSLAVGQITQPPTVHLVTSTPKPIVTPPTTAPLVEASKQRSLDD
ncbi:hypothetical protein E2P60_06170, partial [Candidatus Bathyarchaeota archaeon]